MNYRVITACESGYSYSELQKNYTVTEKQKKVEERDHPKKFYSVKI
jgi:hypothetical protein